MSEALQRLAQIHGIQSSYVDAAGQKRIVSSETVCALLNALEIDVSNDRNIRAALREAEQSFRPLMEPVYVIWGERARFIELRVNGTYSATVHLENGRAINVRQSGLKLKMPKLPFGYHDLQIRVGSRTHSALLICAPTNAYSLPSNHRGWGVFVPIYALHSKESWGVGDFEDCRNCAQWTDSLGGQVLATLPIFASYLDEPFDPSPYAPVSRLFWNEFYLHIPTIPEFAFCAGAQKLVGSRPFVHRVERFRAEALIDYREQMKLRRSVLERLARFFFSVASPRRTQFEQFLKLRPEVRDYARFRAITERQRKGWPHWPQCLQQGRFQSADYDLAVEQYHLFVQFCAQQQVDQLRAASGKTALYLDLPLGVNADGFDSWRYHDLFVCGASGGAPPDPFFTKGQNWGFAPFHPQRLRESHYRYYIEFIRFAMQHTGLLRLDHIMGLHRLYWIPRGFPASQGAYVTYPAEEFYAILCLESHRQTTALVGENLGTVPPEVNKSMARHGLSGMYVVQYEQQSDHKNALRPPARKCVASLNTHDMPPFAAHWKGLDLPDRAALGLITPKKLKFEKLRRRKMNKALVRFLRRGGFLKPKDKTSASTLLRGCLRFLGHSEAELLLVNLEDLWNEIYPQNTPGTFRERPNWRHKTRLSLEQIQQSRAIRSLLNEIEAIRKGE